MKKFLSLALVFCMMFAFGAQAEPLTGEADGFGGPVVVTITKDGDRIVTLEVKGDGETPGIGSNAIEQLPIKIIEANGTQVDVIAGATVTSEAIIKAVEAALAATAAAEAAPATEAATGEQVAPAGEIVTGEAEGFGGPVVVTITKDGDKIVDVQIVADGETPGIGDKAAEELAAKMIETGSAEADIVAGATYTSEAVLKAVQTALGGGAPAGETVTGEAEGFGGPVVVTITKDGDKIVDVQVVGDSETPGIGSNAIDQLPDKIVEAGSAEVDAVAGATVTSNAIIKAVKIALGLEAPEAAPTEAPAAEAVEAEAAEAYIGFGVLSSGRVRKAREEGKPTTYNINQVLVSAVFDKDGKVLYNWADMIEVTSPNGAGHTPVFSGWPGQGGLKDVDGNELTVTNESFQAEFATWETKRDRGDGYKMNTGTWVQEMDAYQNLFNGKTVAEIEDWYKKYTSDVNGRPLTAAMEGEQDVAKYTALTDEEKAMLADVTTMATMSLNDSHGDIVGTYKAAYENRVPLTKLSSASFGFGMDNSGRIGPGKDDKEIQVYSMNQVFVQGLFDAEGKVLALNIDQLEVASPNYDGATMPHFSGYPGQTPYSSDLDHDQKADETAPEITDDTFLAEFPTWLTKRARGEGYKMGTGTWSTQMDKYEQLFVGKTVEEIEDWFSKYTAKNGRPLKDGLSDTEDSSKYMNLSDEEKAMLADVTTAATMSLNDSHGNILAAIKDAYANRMDVQLKVGE